MNKLKVLFIILITLLIISTVGFIIVGKYQIGFGIGSFAILIIGGITNYYSAKSNDYIYQNKHKR